jgi:hypothetical protein
VGQHSILIRVENEHRLLGRIIIRQGEVWSAEDSQGEGEDALRRLLGHKNGRGLCETLREQSGERNIGQQPWFGILLEAARERDETARGNDDLSRMIDEELSRAVEHAAAEAVPTTAAATMAATTTAATMAATTTAATTTPGTTAATKDDGFDALLARGVDATIERDYAGALKAFMAARSMRPDDPIVAANIRRLEKLGYRAV